MDGIVGTGSIDRVTTELIYEIVKPILPNARYGVIANKQDVPGAVDVEAIKKVYELPTIGMVAIDNAKYGTLKDFIEGLIEGA